MSGQHRPGKVHIGMRNVKTAASATLVALLYFLIDRNPTFACIGAVFGTGKDVPHSWLNGGNRLFGTIIGGYVTDGKIERNSGVRVIRDGIVIYTGELASLRRFKDDVKEVKEGYECGLQIEKYNDVREGDELEIYVMRQINP